MRYRSSLVGVKRQTVTLDRSFSRLWWAEMEERYAQRQRMGLGNFGPPRPC